MNDKTISIKKGHDQLSARFSSLTGAEIEAKRVEIGITKYQMARAVGIGHKPILAILSGKKDGKIPVAFDLAFALAQYEPDLWERKYENKRPWGSARVKRVANERAI